MRSNSRLAMDDDRQVKDTARRIQWREAIAPRLQPIVTRVAGAIAERLNREIEAGHDASVFIFALWLAILKDGLLDWGLNLIGIGLIPIVGQIPGWLVSGILYYFLWGKGWFRRTKIRVGYWVLALFFDNLPGFEELPLTTIEVCLAWWMIRHRARQAETELRAHEQKMRATLEAG